MGTLRVYRGDQFVMNFELGEGRTRVGRGTENQLVLEDKDKQVSRSHAEIWYDRGHYVIADLNSQNGVWIGERQIRTEEPLPPNVPVTIGPYRLILEASQVTTLADSAEMTGAGEAYFEPTLPADAMRAPASEAAIPTATQRGRIAAPVAKSPAKPVPKRSMMGAIAAVIVVLVIAAVAAAILRSRRGPETTVSETQTTSVPPAETTVPPTATPEETFLDHFGRAQALLETGNAAGAREENTLALAALPNDERGLAQQRGIGGILNPPPPTIVEPKTPPAGADDPARLAREKGARDRLEEAKRALDQRRYADAMTIADDAARMAGDSTAIVNEANGVAARARSAKAAEDRRALARKNLDDARALASSDLLAAVKKLQDARNLDPDMEGLAELSNSLGQEARTQGEAAVKLAKTLENRDRLDQAMREYDRAVHLLEAVPGGHKDLEFARQRLAELKK